MVTLFVLTACLLALALLFGRRFGVLILGLAAGLVVSGYMSATLVAVSTPYLKQYVSYVPPALVLLPALILLVVAKGRHRALIPRIINAVVFAAAGLVFVVIAPSTPVSLSGQFGVITSNAGLLVSGLVVVALAEIAFGKASKKKLDEDKK